MPETFHFSPRPNRAAEVRWRAWGRAALDEAARTDRPVLLNLTAVWCHWCHVMDETTYSDPEVIRAINESLVPIRVDADRYLHVQDRYIAGGWPTNAFLTPTGEVLWAGTYVPPDEFRSVMNGVLTAWRDRRAQLEEEIGRRRKALEAARSRRPAVGLVRREAADDVVTALYDGFDPRNGGFGEAPKFPNPDAVELLFTRADRLGTEDDRIMAERTLDGMIAGELWDPVDGGFFRYATAEDWTRPHYEKLLDVNAALLRAYALGAAVAGREDWRRVAERTVEWTDRTLGRPDGLWGGSQDADEEYYALEEDGRRARPAPFVDRSVYTNWNGWWIRALAEAGGRLGREDWIDRAAASLTTLLESMAAPDDLLYHFRAPDGEPAIPGLLVDVLGAAHACAAVAQATGRPEFLAHARRLADAMERSLWSDDGGFIDHVRTPEDVGALRYADRPFDLNAEAARLFNDLALATGERSYRAITERTLAVLSPLAGRYGAGAAAFASAVEEFFDPPLRIVLVGSAQETAPLRLAALALAVPERRVWTLESGGTIDQLRFDAAAAPAAFVCGARACSPPVREPAALPAAVAAVR